MTAGVLQKRGDVNVDNKLKAASSESLTAGPSLFPAFKIGKKMASIAHGGVVECYDDNGKKYAAKYLNVKEKPRSEDLLKWESFGMQQISHDNVLTTGGSYVDGDHAYILTELCSADMYAATEESGDLSITCARALFLQMANAVAACHAAGIAHRDIKFENFFVQYKNGATGKDMTKPNRLNDICIKLGDFGFWCQSRDDKGALVRARESCGSDVYGAPEQVLKGMKTSQGYDPEKADIFSLGVCAFMLVCGFPCWESNQSMEDPYNVIWTSGEVGTFWTIIDHHTGGICTDEFKDLFSRMVSLDANQRPSIQEVLNHPWVTGKGRVRFTPSQNAVPQKLQNAITKAVTNK